jgi:hypothetical protein
MKSAQHIDYPFRQTWASKPGIGFALLPVGIGLAWAVADAPWFPRYLTWFVSLIIIMAALGALMSTSILVDKQRTLILRYRMFGIPFSTMRFEPEHIRLTQVELRTVFATSSSSGISDGSDGSRSKSLRIYLELCSDQGLNLVKADSISLPGNCSSPDSAREVLGWFRSKGKQKFLMQGIQLADALGLPLVCIGDWGRDKNRELVYAGTGDELKAVDASQAQTSGVVTN